MRPDEVALLINSWTSECDACGYGQGGYTNSPAIEGLPILTPESTACHGCGERFTVRINLYTGQEDRL